MTAVLTEQYRIRNAEWLAEEETIAAKYCALGLNGTDPAAGDLDLYEEIWRQEITVKFRRSSWIARLSTTIGPWNPPIPPGASYVEIKEFGLFDWGPITVQNANLEAATDTTPNNWTAENLAAARDPEEYEGTYSAKLTAAAANARFYQDITPPTGYLRKEFSLWAAVKTSAPNVKLFISDTSYSSIEFSDAHPADGAWHILRITRVHCTFSPLRIGIQLAASGDIAYFDFVNLVASGILIARAVPESPVQKGPNQSLLVVFEIEIEEPREEFMPLIAFAKQELTVSTTVVQLDASIYAPTGETPAQRAVLTLDSTGGDIRYWYHPDGTEPPSSTSGHELKAGSMIILEGATNIKNFRTIRKGDIDGKLKITFER